MTIAINNASAFLKMYSDVYAGRLITPRGERTREAEDYDLTLTMTESPLTSFEDRNLSLDYAKAEAKWYLRGDRYDRSIETHASMWPKLRQPDNSYYSNYGHYMFREGQVQWVIDELCRDKDSRRATIVLMKRDHLFRENRDVVCTYGVGFRVRNDRLNMTVHMRSNDVVFGTTNDVFCFSVVYRMVYAALKFTN